MSRRRRPRRAGRSGEPPPFLDRLDRGEQWQGLDYVVRPLRGSSSVKAYRCPGCEQQIRPGTPHLVVWSAGDPDAADRRHWHASCWEAREHRGPRPRRHR